MEGQGRCRKSRIQLLRQVRLSGSNSARRDKCGAARAAAGFLFGEGSDSAEIGNRGLVYQRVRQIAVAAPGLFLPIPVGALPSVLGNIEYDVVRVLELAFEVAVPIVAEVEEEFAAVRLDV